MTHETPTKVMSLLGASLLSLAFLFSVSVSNASFSGTETAVPNPFSPQNVVAVLDGAANSYSKAVFAYLITPAQQQYAYFADSVQQDYAFVSDNTNLDQRIVAMAGLNDLLWQEPMAYAHPAPHSSGQVAGAYTMHAIAQIQ